MKFWGKSASGVLPICKKTGRILIGLRSENVLEPFTWGNFGGGIGINDEGEDEECLSPKDNAVKEFREETGYSGDIELIDSYIYKNGTFFYYNFIGMIKEEFEPIPNWEIQTTQWVTLDKLLYMKDLHFGLHALLMQSYEQIMELKSVEYDYNKLPMNPNSSLPNWMQK